MNVVLRQACEDDHPRIVEAVRQWWSDSRDEQQRRELARLVPRLFLQHFASTSVVAEVDGRFGAFLVGFHSFDQADAAYIHFVGVDPNQRGTGLGRQLYETFFQQAKRSGRTRVCAITSPMNSGSIAFHRSLGFDVLPGDAERNGVAVHQNYDGEGGDRVCFQRML